jgi:lysophospholipase L1-like esterase
MAAVALLEAVLRSIPRFRAGFYRYSETYGWELRAGSSSDIGRVRISVNRDGHRGRAVEGARKSGVRRILMLGDSVAFGVGVGDDQTFSARMDRPGAGLEVVNLGVPGYGPAQQLLLLRTRGLAYRPDTVVVHFCLANDFADAVLSEALYDQHPAPYLTIESGGLKVKNSHLQLGVARGLLQRLSESSALCRTVSAFLSRATTVDSRGAADASRWPKRKRRALHDTNALSTISLWLASLNELSRSAGSQLLLVIHPDRTLDRGNALWSSVLKGLAMESRIPVLDMADYYRENGFTFDQVTIDGVGHLSTAGHAVVAQALERALRELRPLDAASDAKDSGSPRRSVVRVTWSQIAPSAGHGSRAAAGWVR